jgi:hypothetical protein
MTGDLALRERPQGQVVHPAGEGVADGRDPAQVRRTGEQELARRVIAVDS